MQRWQTKLATRRIREDELVKQFDTCRARIFFKLWQAKLKHKRQIAWRNDMRQKMKIMKNRSDARIIKGAWKIWQQLHLEHRADTLYQSNLVIRYYSQWKEGLLKLDDMYNLADQFSESVQFALLKACFKRWTQTMNLRRDEHVMIQRIDRRIMTNSLDLWRKRM
jgi:protein SFI1